MPRKVLRFQVRKRALGTRRPMEAPTAVKVHWILNLVSEAVTDGRRARILGVVDDFTRVNLALIADTSLSGARIVRELTALCDQRGYPTTSVSDNGTELTSTAVLKSVQKTRVDGITSSLGSQHKKRLLRASMDG